MELIEKKNRNLSFSLFLSVRRHPGKSVPEQDASVPAIYEGSRISCARLEYLPGGRRDRRVKQNVKLSIFHEQSII